MRDSISRLLLGNEHCRNGHMPVEDDRFRIAIARQIAVPGGEHPAGFGMRGKLEHFAGFIGCWSSDFLDAAVAFDADRERIFALRFPGGAVNGVGAKRLKVATVAAFGEGSHQEVAKVFDVWIQVGFGQEQLYAVADGSPALARSAGEQLHEAFLESGDVLLAVAAALETHAVNHADFGARPAGGDHDHEGGHIGSHAGHAANESVPANSDKVVDSGMAAHVDVVFDVNMAGELDVIGEDAVAADDAVVSNVNADEKQISVADACDAAAISRAGMNSDQFAEDIIFSDFEGGFLSGVFEVLRPGTQHRLWEDFASLPKGCMPLDRDQMVDAAPVFDTDMGAYHGVGADFHVLPDLGAFTNDRCLMNAQTNYLVSPRQ